MMNIDDGALYWACDLITILIMAVLNPALLCEITEGHVLAFKSEVRG